MSEDSESKRETAPSPTGGQSKLISIIYDCKDGPLNYGKISDYRKEGKYVDVTLKFDDGQLISCHRCILASSSGYFDSLFSNGMKESSEDVIHIGNISSSVFATALDYVYTGRCSFTHDIFIELLLLANMLELKDLEGSLLFYLTKCKMTELKINDSRYKVPIERQQITDIFVHAWVFCHKYSVIADSLSVPVPEGYEYYNWETDMIPFKTYVLNFIRKQKNENLLATSEILLSLDELSLFQLLGDFGFTDILPSHTLKIVSAWLLKQERDAEAPEFENLFESLMTSLRLYSVTVPEIKEIWGDDSLRTKQILAIRDEQESQEFLVIPDCGESPGFICHDANTGENYYLDPPTTEELEGRFYGSPKLKVESDGLSYCVRAFHSGEDLPSFLIYQNSFTGHRWIQKPYPDMKITKPPDDHPESNVPRQFVDFFVTSFSDNFRDPIVKVGFEVKAEASSSAVEKSQEEDVADYTPTNLVEVVSFNPTGEISRECNFWDGRIANFEVSGVGVYKTKDDEPGVVVFGNSFAKRGKSEKKPHTLLNPVRERDGFPDGACDNPLNVVPLHDRTMYVMPSNPFTTVDEGMGELVLKLPRVWSYTIPSKRWEENELWSLVTTPSCPDLDYATLYYDRRKNTLGLILVQKPPCEASFTHVYGCEMRQTRHTRQKMGQRIVGRFVLRDRNTRKLKSLASFHNAQSALSPSCYWEPLPVSDGLADFLALGSRLSGEVRISCPLLNIKNLRPIKLARYLIGDGPDFNVEVLKHGEEPPLTTRPMTQWLKHEDSPFHDVPSTIIEEKLNACVKRDKSLLDSLKKRRLAHPLLPDAPLTPFRSIKFKSDSQYSLKSYGSEEEEEDGDDDDDDDDDELIDRNSDHWPDVDQSPPNYDPDFYIDQYLNGDFEGESD